MADNYNLLQVKKNEQKLSDLVKCVENSVC